MIRQGQKRRDEWRMTHVQSSRGIVVRSEWQREQKKGGMDLEEIRVASEETGSEGSRSCQVVELRSEVWKSEPKAEN